jgi:hypothetical protein
MRQQQRQRLQGVMVKASGRKRHEHGRGATYDNLPLTLFPRTHALTHSRTRVPIQLSPPHWSDSCMACMLLLLLLLLLAAAQVVVERAVVRSGWQLDSGKIGEMETGEELDVVESVTHPETGVERARFTYMGQDAWTSVASTNGVLILRQVE